MFSYNWQETNILFRDQDLNGYIRLLSLNIHTCAKNLTSKCKIKLNVLYNYNCQETNIQFYDQDLNEDFSLRYPKLYTPGHYDLLFNKKVFALSAAEGIISSLVLFFIPYGAFFNAVRPDGHDLVSHNAFGCVVASILIVAVTLRVSSTDDSDSDCHT